MTFKSFLICSFTFIFGQFLFKLNNDWRRFKQSWIKVQYHFHFLAAAPSLLIIGLIVSVFFIIVFIFFTDLLQRSIFFIIGELLSNDGPEHLLKHFFLFVLGGAREEIDEAFIYFATMRYHLGELGNFNFPVARLMFGGFSWRRLLFDDLIKHIFFRIGPL